MSKIFNTLIWLFPAFAFAGNARPTTGIAKVANFIWLVVDTVTGPWGIGISIIAIVAAGATWAMSDHGAGTRKVASVGLGVVIIVNATSWIATLFGAQI